jgi:hypothetical protein
MITIIIAIFLIALCYHIMNRTVFINVCTFKRNKKSKVKRIYITMFIINWLLLFFTPFYCIIGCCFMIVFWIIHHMLCTKCTKNINIETHNCENCIAVKLKNKNIFDKIILFIIKKINKIN